MPEDKDFASEPGYEPGSFAFWRSRSVYRAERIGPAVKGQRRDFSARTRQDGAACPQRRAVGVMRRLSSSRR